MGSRGRVSSASLTIISSSGIEAVDRPKPLHELTDEQQVEWRNIVNRMPADWFSAENLSMLAQLCRHITRARRLASLLERQETSKEVDVKEYRDLLRSEEEQSRAIASLCTKMRLSQQTTYDKSKKKPVQTKKPWEG